MPTSWNFNWKAYNLQCSWSCQRNSKPEHIHRYDLKNKKVHRTILKQDVTSSLSSLHSIWSCASFRMSHQVLRISRFWCNSNQQLWKTKEPAVYFIWSVNEWTLILEYQNVSENLCKYCCFFSQYKFRLQ